MTKKFVFDQSSESVMRVVGYARTWEQLSPGVRVRRRVIAPWGNEDITNAETWYSTLRVHFDDSSVDSE